MKCSRFCFRSIFFTSFSIIESLVSGPVCLSLTCAVEIPRRLQCKTFFFFWLVLCLCDWTNKITPVMFQINQSIFLESHSRRFRSDHATFCACYYYFSILYTCIFFIFSWGLIKTNIFSSGILTSTSTSMVCMCACVRECVRACVRVCVCVCEIRSSKLTPHYRAF